jgi:hypothetical protein
MYEPLLRRRPQPGFADPNNQVGNLPPPLPVQSGTGMPLAETMARMGPPASMQSRYGTGRVKPRYQGPLLSADQYYNNRNNGGEGI